jgi:hypothetical protein
MLFKNFNNPNLDYSINEGNFISGDIFGLIDSDAEFRLSQLTIDKLFEGLDIEKSEAMHNFIKSNIPSLSEVMGKSKSTGTNSFELIRAQFTYIKNQISNYERELATGFQEVLNATKSQGIKNSTKRVSQITSPSGISSIIPKIDEVVKLAKTNKMADFNSESLKQSFLSLYGVNVIKIIDTTLESLYQSAQTVGLKDLYTKIDAKDLQKIESDSASTFPGNLIGANIDLDKMLESTDVYDRFSAFLEFAISKYPFGSTLKEKFGQNYNLINLSGYTIGPDAILTLRQFNPSADISVFEPLSQLLNEVSSILIKRVYVDSQEHFKNIFTPALQVMFVCMIVLLALKLINLNIEVEVAGVQKEEEIKKSEKEKEYQEKVDRVKKLLVITEELESMNFFQRGGVVYKVGSRKMSADNIKLINNYLVLLKYLPSTKLNDGNYDTATASAVTKFQENYGLRMVDGMIGNETKAEIKEVANNLKIKYNIQNIDSSVMGSL